MWALGAFAILIVLQGAFRKWWLPSLSTPLYVAKDIALLGALTLFATHGRLRLPFPIRRTALPWVWGLFALTVIAQCFNFNFPSLLGSAVGARGYLLYMVLLILMPAAMEHVQRPERWVTVVSLGVVIPVLTLGIYQYYQPTTAWINQYVSEDQTLAAVGGRPRIVGTFSYIGGMAAFLTFSIFWGLAMTLTGFLRDHRLYKALGACVLLLALIVAPMNGSRSVVLGALVPLPFTFYALLKGRRGSKAVVGLSLLVLVGGYAIGQSGWASEGWSTLEQRATTASDRDTRITTMLTDPIRKVPVGGLFGYGTGSTHQGAGALAPGGVIQIPGVYYEGEFGRVIIELGVIGGGLYFLLKVMIAWFAWRALRRAKTSWHTFLATLCFSTVFLQIAIGPIVFHHVNGSIYWMCAGVAIWLWSKQEVQINHRRIQSRSV